MWRPTVLLSLPLQQGFRALSQEMNSHRKNTEKFIDEKFFQQKKGLQRSPQALPIFGL
jgi:hypothetical protein